MLLDVSEAKLACVMFGASFAYVTNTAVPARPPMIPKTTNHKNIANTQCRFFLGFLGPPLPFDFGMRGGSVAGWLSYILRLRFTRDH